MATTTSHHHIVTASGGAFILHNAFMLGTEHLQGALTFPDGAQYVYQWSEGDTVTFCTEQHA